MNSPEIALQQFVSETLLQIVKGVKDAQAGADQLGAIVNPSIATSPEHAAKHGLLKSVGEYAQLVQFDVALSAKAGTATKGGIGVFVGVVSLGSAGQSSAENASISRVKFVVPLTLPTHP